MYTQQGLNALLTAIREVLENAQDSEQDRDENGAIYRDIARLTIAYADVVPWHDIDTAYVAECDTRLRGED